MNKNPLLNAVLAELYIVIVALSMYYGLKFVGARQETVFIPIAMLSLFTLSAAVMGYLFVSEPAQLYLEGDKKGAVSFFLKTVFIFGSITALIFISLFLW